MSEFALGPDDLVLCAGTLPRASLADQISVAANAGFKGLSLYYEDYRLAKADGVDDADLKTRLDDSGIVLAELDPLLNWLPQEELAGGLSAEGRSMFETTEDDYYAVADTLGARSLNLALFVTRIPELEIVAEAFAGVCDRAAEHGLLVHLEFLPWTPIPSLDVASEVARLANRTNGGIMIDSWHFFRSGGEPAEIGKLRGDQVLGVQLNDAPAKPGDNVVFETLNHRLLPGEGDIDLIAIIRELDRIGSKAPIGVEVFSQELKLRPAAEVAKRAAETTRGVLEAARG